MRDDSNKDCQTCYPQNMPPVYATQDPCARLGMLRDALYQLMSGAATALVRDADRQLQFQQGNATQLRLEIQKLEHMCPRSPANPFGARNPHRRAVRVGPFSNRPGFYGYPYAPYGYGE